jgi:hypothetical protein
MKSLVYPLTAILLASGAALAQVDPVDVILSVQNGRLVTGRVDPGSGLVLAPRYVFAGTLGDTGIPGATFNPGFDSEPGDLPPTTLVGLTIRRALRVWDGAGFAPIAQPPSPPAAVQIIKNTTTIVTPELDPAACGVGDSLVLGQTSSGGNLHTHPAYQLVNQTTAGIYLVEVELWLGSPGSAVSDPVYILLDQNAPAQAAAAFAWADSNLTGPPACRANCDGSTTSPILNVADFSCFLNRFASGDCAANCDGSTTSPVLNIADFSCFLNLFAAGCS